MPISSVLLLDAVNAAPERMANMSIVKEYTLEEVAKLPDSYGLVAKAMLIAFGHYSYTDLRNGNQVSLVLKRSKK